MVRVLIGYPCSGGVNPWFAQSLATGMLDLHVNPPCDLQMALLFVDGSILPANRQDIADKAVEKADVLITLDSDMRFPPETFGRLLSHYLEGKKIVACNYTRRREPYCPTGYKDGHCVYQGEGLERVDHAGLGVTMIACEVFEAIEKPYFPFTWEDQWKGEDVNFFAKARKAGYEVWLDHMIGVTHIGDFEFDMPFAEVFREETIYTGNGQGKPKEAKTNGSQAQVLTPLHEGLPRPLGGRSEE